MLIAILPLLFIQVVIVGGITLFFALQEFNANVNQFLQQRENDILTISENPDILNYLQNIHYELEDEAVIYKNNLEDLFEKLVKRSEPDQESIYKKIVFIDSQGKEIAKKDNENQLTIYKNVTSEDYFNKAKELEENKIIKEKVSKDLMLIYSPLYLDKDGNGETEFSGVLLIKSIYPLDEFKKATIISSLLTAILVIIGIAILYSTIRVVKKLVEPIHELVDATNSLSMGNLNVRAHIESRDEIGQLADSFNRMADDLKTNINELEEYKNELEIKVAQRTNELEKSNQDLSEAYKELKSTQAQLIHSEKMASLGQLVAGVAHELNNPINFIYGNMPHLKNYIGDIKAVLNRFEQSSIDTTDKDQIEKLKKDVNWEFILPDLDVMIKDCHNGAQRAKDIVQDLKNFSRLGEAEFKYADIHFGIDSTLNLLANYFKNKIKIEKDYADFGKIECYPEQLNQVFMNLLSNAAQAMPKEKIESGEATIWITTRIYNNSLQITIEDNATGIPEEDLKKVFDPFYTTKPVGEGTGLGLSITYGIIEKHGGSINVESQTGKGTRFIIELPVKQQT